MVPQTRILASSWSVLTAAVVLGACAYDFDGAFSGSSGGAGGVGGAGSGGVGGASSGTHAGTTTGMVGSELCFNGRDDDDDGLIDCEDEDCLDGICGPLPPTEWGDPIAVASVAWGTELPDCAADWTDSRDVSSGLAAPDAICAACTCGAPEVQCSIPGITIYEEPSCNQAGATISPLGDGVCTSFDRGDFDSFNAPEPVLSSASCVAGGGGATLPPLAWEAQFRLCSETSFGQGCDAGLCVPASDDFVVCVAREGDHRCPDGYDDRQLVHDGAMDTRDCSTCSCGSPSNPDCGGVTEVWYGNTLCGGAATSSQNNNGGCNTINAGTQPSSLVFTSNHSAGPCPTNGGAPIGDATPINPVTICCVP